MHDSDHGKVTKNPGRAGILNILCGYVSIVAISVTTAAAAVAAITAATATIATVTSTAATVAEVAPTETATATLTTLPVLWLCLVDDELAPHHLKLVEAGDCLLAFFGIVHLHKTEALAASRLTVGDDFCGTDFTELGEEVEEVLVPELEIDVSDVDVHTC
jgi:hypothetical protein